MPGHSPLGLVELCPTTMTTDGEALGRDSTGRVVFVRGALPGEQVQVEVIVERPKSATARLVEILEASGDRVAPPCDQIARGCGGCPWQHAGLEAQRRWKAELVRNAIRVGATVPPVPSPTVELAPWAFRTALRAGVVDGRAGFHREHSEDLVTVDACLVAHPLLAELLIGRRYAGAREVTMRCGARTSERLVATAPGGIRIDVPRDVMRMHFHEEAAGRTWQISAGSFFQTRPDGADALAALVGEAADQCGAPGRAIDLYSGVGLFAGVLADRGWSVTAVENAPSAVGDARSNLAGSGVRVLRADATGWQPSPAELVVADPSRIGLGRGGVGVVSATGSRRLILVSCDAVSLGRDARLLAKAGYAMTALTLVDLFPHTPHVEVVSVFDR